MKSPHFFCENCGAEVPLRAKKCPRCGRVFEAVRCPSCAFVGNEALFTRGCPVCGYTAPPPSAGKAKTGAPGQEWASAGALPWWVYLLAVLFFIGACGVLIVFL